MVLFWFLACVTRSEAGGGAACGSHVDCFLNIFRGEVAVCVVTREDGNRLLQNKSFYQIPRLQSKPRQEPPLFLWNSSSRDVFNTGSFD